MFSFLTNSCFPEDYVCLGCPWPALSSQDTEWASVLEKNGSRCSHTFVIKWWSMWYFLNSGTVKDTRWWIRACWKTSMAGKASKIIVKVEIWTGERGGLDFGRQESCNCWAPKGKHLLNQNILSGKRDEQGKPWIIWQQTLHNLHIQILLNCRLKNGGGVNSSQLILK